MGFLLLASFLASVCWAFRHRFFIWLSFVVVTRCVLCLSSFCVPLWSCGYSSGHLVTFCVLLALLPSLFWRGCSFSIVSGFNSSCFGFPVGLPRVFLLFLVAFLSSSRIVLRCRGSLVALCFPPFCHFGDFVFSFLGGFSFFSTGFQFSSLSCLLSLLGFVPFLHLPRLPLLCLDVEASWCVSSYGFFVGWSSYFLVLSCGCCLFNFLRVFASCFRFLGLFSSWRGFAGVW